MPFPSIITIFTNPLPTNRLNSPSHSTIETQQNTSLTEIETFVGTTASIPGTLVGDIRSPASDGGGHIQSASKGGTGQTSYAKGNILVASSSSVLTKVVVGNNGEAFVADSSQPTGVKWAPVSSPTAQTVIPTSALPVDTSNADPVAAFTLQSSALGYVGQINIPYNISVNKVRFIAAAGQLTTSVLVGIYSEDGQTQKIAATFAAVSTSVQTALVSSVTLNGVYYIVATTPQGDPTSAAIGVWATNGNGTVIDKIWGLPNAPVIEGTIPITSGALPTTINPVTITSVLGRTLVVRLDN